MRSYILMTVLFLGSAACVHRIDLMQANAVSMTHRELPDGAKLTIVGPISSRYCADQFKASSGKAIGMIDEATKTAEKEHKVDFILHANFYQEGDCTIIEGEGARIEK